MVQSFWNDAVVVQVSGWSISWFGAEPGRALESAQNDSPSLHQLHVRGGQGASASDLKVKTCSNIVFWLKFCVCCDFDFDFQTK